MFLIMKQRFLETLSWKGSGGEKWVFPPWKPMISSFADQDTTDLQDILQQVNNMREYCNTQVRKTAIHIKAII
jgi:hypothetical protein